MKIKELRDKTTEALEKRERELYEQLFKLRFQMATNQNENPGRIRLARKELARAKTILRERRGPASASAARSSSTAAAPKSAVAKE